MDKLTKKQKGYLEGHAFNGDSYYVYALVCPIEGQAFYIGKGKGRRLFSHERELRKSSRGNSDKIKRIAAIKLANKEVEYQVIRHGLTENQALSLEIKLIDEKFDFLTNKNRHNAPSAHGLTKLEKQVHGYIKSGQALPRAILSVMSDKGFVLNPYIRHLLEKSKTMSDFKPSIKGAQDFYSGLGLELV